jgi:hypothetical protein
MHLTRFADETTQSLISHIKDTKKLGWKTFEASSFHGQNIHKFPIMCLKQRVSI